MMEKFYELFRRDLKTERLELRRLQPSPENAGLVWDIIKNENPNDFRFVNWTPNYIKPIPESLDETLHTMEEEENFDVGHNGAIWYVFHNGKIIGHYGVFYFDYNKSVEIGNVWFVKSAWGHGFNHEILELMEKMAFEELGAHRVLCQCMADNLRSKKSILGNGFHFDGCIRGTTLLPDGTWMDELIFTKLEEEHKKQG